MLELSVTDLASYLLAAVIDVGAYIVLVEVLLHLLGVVVELL